MGSEPAPGGGLRAARAVADAILYEGYVLYPYRRSSPKNRVRWQFGVLVPRTWASAQGLADTGVAGSAESWWQQTECLVDAPGDTPIEVRVRFLQLRRKTVVERCGDGSYEPVDAVTVGTSTELTVDEADPREVVLAATLGEVARCRLRRTVMVPGGAEVTTLPGAPDARASGPGGRTGAFGGRASAPDGRTGSLGGRTGAPDGRSGAPEPGPWRVRRRRWPLVATVEVSAVRCGRDRGVWRLRVRTENNATGVDGHASREEALRRSLLACHTLVAAPGGAFLSLLDPPSWAETAARGCVNVHTFPVLAGEDGQRDVVLSSPVLLYDFPRVAPESPGDLCDATEIDEILSLRTLTLTDAEKREARATDPRAAAIIDRVDSMPDEVMARLHGAVRSLRPVPAAPTVAPAAAPAVPAPAPAAAPTGAPAAAPAAGATGAAGAVGGDPGGDAWPEVPWWGADADASIHPETDHVVAGGVRLARGSRVRLRPRARGADPHDMFLDGRAARVASVLTDVDGSRYLAVTLEDDPAAELSQWHGRFRHFAPDEVEPLPAREAEPAPAAPGDGSP